jgi:hypothetical protein
VTTLRPGEEIRVRDWPDTFGQRFLVKAVDEARAVVHAFAIDGRFQDGRPRRAGLRSFPLANVETA